MTGRPSRTLARVVAPMAVALLALALRAESGACPKGEAAARLGEQARALHDLFGDGRARFPELQREIDAVKPVLDGVDRALAAGRLYVALENLIAARNALEPVRFIESQAESLAALDEGASAKARAALRAKMDEHQATLGRATPATEPAAVRALREEARLKARVLADTVPMWAEGGDRLGALYYGGEGLSWARLASFLERSGFPANARPATFPPMAAKIEAYERELIEAYRPPVSAEHHATFIAASAALKTAKELDLAGSREGALFQYLRARSLGAQLHRAATAPPELDALAASVGASRELVESLTGDSSLACLYQEEAESALSALREGRDPERAARRAAVLLEDVLPEYLRLMDPAAQAAQVAIDRKEAPAVTVTLVRWPYT